MPTLIGFYCFLLIWNHHLDGAIADPTLTLPESNQSSNVIEVSGVRGEEPIIRHHVKDRNVYIEVVISPFQFKKPTQSKKVNGEGHVHLFLNGKKVDEIYQAAFIVKGLPPGKHQLKVEIVHNDHSPYPIAKEFDVDIQ